MNLYSPEPIIQNRMVAIMSKGMNVEVYDQSLDMTIPKRIIVTYFNEFKTGADGKTTTTIPGEQIARGVIAAEVSEFYLLQKLIGICATNAETINRSLLSVLNNLNNKQHFNADYANLDFMKLRDALSEWLKKEKKIEAIEALSSNGKVKDFTKTFYRYITDRNIYTLGELSLDILGGRFIIHAKVEGKESYFKIDKAICQSHLDCYKDLRSILTKLNIYFQSQH